MRRDACVRIKVKPLERELKERSWRMKMCQFRWAQVNTDRKNIEQYILYRRIVGTRAWFWNCLDGVRATPPESALFLHSTWTDWFFFYIGMTKKDRYKQNMCQRLFFSKKKKKKKKKRHRIILSCWHKTQECSGLDLITVTYSQRFFSIFSAWVER